VHFCGGKRFSVLNRKYFVTILLTGVLAASSAFAAQEQHIQQRLSALEKIQGKFTFIVLGDNRSGDEKYQKLVSLAMERRPDFIVNIGDVIDRPGDVKQWDNFWEISRSIIVPYFLAAGNHDIHPNVPSSEKTYRDQVDLPGNELYYSFAEGNSLFVVLDSQLKGQDKRIIGNQFKWLENVIMTSTHKHVFVFLHHPLYTNLWKGHHSHDSLDKYPEHRDKLQALFAKSRVHAVFAGHEHYYEKRTVDGILHIISGGGGAPMYDREEDGGFFHFIRVTVDGDRVSGEVVDINGRVRDRF
jgi:predicted phosphodiesterase